MSQLFFDGQPVERLADITGRVPARWPDLQIPLSVDAPEALAQLVQKIAAESPRRQFRLGYPGGDYLVFTGVPNMDWPADSAEALVSVADVEIEERGNIYDRQGAD